MTQAREMVTLAESFNKSLKEHEATRQQLPEDAQFIIGSSMARLGLGTWANKDYVKGSLTSTVQLAIHRRVVVDLYLQTRARLAKRSGCRI